MTAPTIAHVLTVKTSWSYCESPLKGCAPADVPCPGHRDMDWDITCPYEGQYNVPGRDCTTWTECGCLITSDEERDRLYDEEEGPCPESPVGTHHFINNADIFPGIPLQGCWPNHCPCTADHVEEFQDKHGDGVWFVRVRPPEDCDDGMEFEPLARLED